MQKTIDKDNTPSRASPALRNLIRAMFDATGRHDGIGKTEQDRRAYEPYGRVVAMSDLDGLLQKQVLGLHSLRKRARPEAWEKMTETREYAAVIKAVATAPGLSRSMRRARLSLIA